MRGAHRAGLSLGTQVLQSPPTYRRWVGSPMGIRRGRVVEVRQEWFGTNDACELCKKANSQGAKVSPSANDSVTDIGVGLPSRYAIILVVDLVESVRLMQEDEAGVIQRWQTFSTTSTKPRYPLGGRLVKNLGDGLMAEFRPRRKPWPLRPRCTAGWQLGARRWPRGAARPSGRAARREDLRRGDRYLRHRRQPGSARLHPGRSR